MHEKNLEPNKKIMAQVRLTPNSIIQNGSGEMSVFLSIHDVKQLEATTVWTDDNKCAAHLTLNFEGRVFEDHGAITFYIGDAVLNARLIEAINSIVAERKAELAAEKQEAA